MKEAFWGWWIIVLGASISVVIMVVTDMTTTSEQDYYMIKEIAEASMYDAVDYGYYRLNSKLRISSEKFMEIFVRRYAEVVSINKTVDIDFYDIYESPPKATVIVSNHTIDAYIDDRDFNLDINNRTDAVLEMDTINKPEIQISN